MLLYMRDARRELLDRHQPVFLLIHLFLRLRQCVKDLIQQASRQQAGRLPVQGPLIGLDKHSADLGWVLDALIIIITVLQVVQSEI